ncbi:MAG: CPBP family intramembrane glutamic endopeptidase [Candidatus Acidiferrales bacterium]
MSADDTQSRPMNSSGQNPPEPELPQAAGPEPPFQAAEQAGPAPQVQDLVAQEFSAPPGWALTEDIRVPWSWLDLVYFVAVALAAAFLVSAFLAGMFAVFHVSAAQIRNSPNEKDFFAVLNQIFLSLALLAYLAVHIRTRYRLPFWRTIGWRPLETLNIPRGLAYCGFIAGGIVLSFVIQIASNALATNAKLPIETFFQDRRTAVLLMLSSILLAPVVEETIFRGYLYPVIARRFGVAASVIATGTLFGALHAAQLWGGWGQIALLIVVGIVFTYVRAVARSVVASYLLHVSYNSVLSILFVITSHGLRALPASF